MQTQPQYQQEPQPISESEESDLKSDYDQPRE